MNQLNFDQLVYPVLMTIRQLKDAQQSKLKQEILDCQNRVEELVLSLMKFTIDYVLEGPDKVQINFSLQKHQIKTELHLKLQQLHQFLSNVEFNQLKKSIKNQLLNPEGFSETSSDNEQETFQMKLTGHLKLFNPEIQKLNNIIKDLKDKLHHFESKEIRRRNSIDQLAAAHIKDIQILKQQIRKQSSDDNDEEYIEAVYFDKTSTLEPEVQEMMNEKIRNIKQQYEKYVQQFMSRKKSQQIEQPQVIKVKHDSEDFTPKDLVRMLLEKESNAYKIWKMFEDQRSFRFLLSVLTNQDKEYGIQYKEINEILKCNKQELKKIDELKQQLQHDSSWMAAQFAFQLQQHKKQILQLQTQIQELICKQVEEVKMISQASELTYEISQIIIDKSNQIQELENENKSQSIQLHDLRINLGQNKRQLEFLLKNIKVILHLLDEKGQIFSQLPQYDWEISKPAIISNLQKMIEKIDPFTCVVYQTSIASLLFTIQLTKIVENSDISPYSKSTQTDNYSDYFVFKDANQENQKKEVSHKHTQTFQISSQKRITKTDNFCDKNQNLASLKLNVDGDVFDRLFETSAKLSQKIKQVKPYLEQMSDNEFSDLLQILNSLRYQQSSNQFQLDISSNSNQVIKLPQDQDLKTTQTQRSQRFILSTRLTKHPKIVKKPSRSVDLQNAMQQANELFSDLERQRTRAQTQFYQSKLASTTKRIPKFLPNTDKLKKLRLQSN